MSMSARTMRCGRPFASTRSANYGSAPVRRRCPASLGSMRRIWIRSQRHGATVLRRRVAHRVRLRATGQTRTDWFAGPKASSFVTSLAIRNGHVWAEMCWAALTPSGFHLDAAGRLLPSPFDRSWTACRTVPRCRIENSFEDSTRRDHQLGNPIVMAVLHHHANRSKSVFPDEIDDFGSLVIGHEKFSPTLVQKFE